MAEILKREKREEVGRHEQEGKSVDPALWTTASIIAF